MGERASVQAYKEHQLMWALCWAHSQPPLLGAGMGLQKALWMSKSCLPVNPGL